MYTSGHLAMGYLAAAGPALAHKRVLDVQQALIPALVGAATPDLIDKPLHALGLITYSRGLGHSIFFFAAVLVLWRWIKHRRPGLSRPMGWWIIGIGTHFFADVINDFFRGLEARGFLFSGWLGWPITCTRDLTVLFDLGREIRIHPTFTSLEIAIFALALVVAIAHRYPKTP